MLAAGLGNASVYGGDGDGMAGFAMILQGTTRITPEDFRLPGGSPTATDRVFQIGGLAVTGADFSRREGLDQVKFHRKVAVLVANETLGTPPARL